MIRGAPDRQCARLRKWGEALKSENNSLGDSLLAYADAWDAEIERASAALHACEGLDTADLKGNEQGWLAKVVYATARIEAENNRLLDAVCVGNRGCDLKARCQSYEASEQNEPCPAGRCVMAADSFSE